MAFAFGRRNSTSAELQAAPRGSTKRTTKLVIDWGLSQNCCNTLRNSGIPACLAAASVPKKLEATLSRIPSLPVATLKFLHVRCHVPVSYGKNTRMQFPNEAPIARAAMLLWMKL